MTYCAVKRWQYGKIYPVPLLRYKRSHTDGNGDTVLIKGLFDPIYCFQYKTYTTHLMLVLQDCVGQKEIKCGLSFISDFIINHAS